MDDLLKLIDIVQKSTELVDKGWSYYSTVTLAALALVYGSEKVRLTNSLRRIIAIGYAIFAVTNCVAIFAAQKAAIRWIDLFNYVLQSYPALPVRPIIPFPPWQLVVAHCVISVIVVVAILMSNKLKE